MSWWNPSANPFHSSVVSNDSMEEGGMLFHSIIQPVSVTKFFRCVVIWCVSNISTKKLEISTDLFTWYFIIICSILNISNISVMYKRNRVAEWLVKTLSWWEGSFLRASFFLHSLCAQDFMLLPCVCQLYTDSLWYQGDIVEYRQDLWVGLVLVMTSSCKF